MGLGVLERDCVAIVELAAEKAQREGRNWLERADLDYH